MEDMFNPSEYTEKELLKLVYRELHNLRTEFDEYRKNNDVQKQLNSSNSKIIAIETQLAIQRELDVQREKRAQRLASYTAVGVTILTVVLNVILKFLNI